MISIQGGTGVLNCTVGSRCDEDLVDIDGNVECEVMSNQYLGVNVRLFFRMC